MLYIFVTKQHICNIHKCVQSGCTSQNETTTFILTSPEENINEKESFLFNLPPMVIFFLQNIDVTFSPLADDSNKFSCKFSILEFSNETTTRAVWVKYLGNSLIRLSKDKFLARQRQTENALKTEERKLTFSVFRSSAAALHCSFVPLLPFIGRSSEIVFFRVFRT